MSSTRIYKLSVILALLLGLFSLASLAASPDRSGLRSGSGLPDYYPEQFQKTGVISEAPANDALIISGLKYQLTPETKIHSTSSQFASRWALKNGEEAGFNFSTNAAGERTLSEIWLLPKGRVVSH